MIRPPTHLKTMSEKREWLEKEISISEEMRMSKAYQSLADESKIILMLMLEKSLEDCHD